MLLFSYFLLFAICTWHKHGFGVMAHNCHSNDIVSYVQTGDLYELVICIAPMEDDEKQLYITNDMMTAASCSNQYRVVEWFLDQGVPMSPTRRELQCAAAMGYIGIVELLLSRSVDNLIQPLLLAASNAQMEAVELLMKHGADPRTTVYCYSPIKWAPEGMYDGMEGRLPTCRQLAAEMQQAYDEELTEKNPPHPPMGLLEENVGVGIDWEDMEKTEESKE